MSAEAVVHVVDDDVAVRRSLAFLLASDGLPVRLHESALAFLDSVGETRGCVVTDVRMPGLDGIAFLRRLRQRDNPPPVIVMTGRADVALAVAAMKEGALDFIEKPFDDEVFLATVRRVLGDPQRAARGEAADSIRGRIAALTGRERQVMDALVAGKANKVIGRDLGISPRTVEIHRANLMTKMGAGTLPDLVRMAIAARGGPD
ncbi:response regulator FixJ [Methylobacterium sp. JK268]